MIGSFTPLLMSLPREAADLVISLGSHQAMAFILAQTPLETYNNERSDAEGSSQVLTWDLQRAYVLLGVWVEEFVQELLRTWVIFLLKIVSYDVKLEQ